MKASLYSIGLRLLLASVFAAAAATATVYAQLPEDFAEGNKYVQTNFFYAPGSDARIGVRFTIEPGWHIYWRNSGEAGLPTKIEWGLPQGWSAGELRWPLPWKHIERGGVITYGYEGGLILSAPLSIPPGSAAQNLRATASWLVCKDICVPGSRSMEVEYKPGTQAPASLLELIAVYERQVPSENPLKQISVSPLTTEIRVKEEQTAVAGFRLSGLNVSAETAVRNIQLFPFESDDFEIGQPLLQAQNNDLELRFSIRPLSGAPSPADLRFALALSRELLGTNADASGVISLRVIIDDTAPGVSEPPAGLPLVFREVRYEEPVMPPPQETSSIWPILLLAFLGGLLLNLMPCVLPVLSLKVLGILEGAGQTKAQARQGALAYALGILSSFMVLSAAVALFRTFGMRVGWGFQFQYPGFVFTLLLAVFVFGLGFFDLYFIHLPGVQQIAKGAANVKDSRARHFLDGVLATALATPCTAPFLGTALVFAFSQPSLVVFLVFFMIGLGLALPYALLVTNPRLIAALPKPGPWMVWLKEAMGLFLFGTALWLLYVLHHLNSESTIPALLVLFTVFVLFWLQGALRETRLGKRSGRGVTVVLTALFAGLLFFQWPAITARPAAASMKMETESGIWEPYSASAVANAISQGRTVFLDFTAEWCITCKFNEKFVLKGEAVRRKFSELNVAAFRADWTDGSPEITSALTSYGGRGVPHYVVVSRNSEPRILPTLLSASLLLDALDAASAPDNR